MRFGFPLLVLIVLALLYSVQTRATLLSVDQALVTAQSSLKNALNALSAYRELYGSSAQNTFDTSNHGVKFCYDSMTGIPDEYTNFCELINTQCQDNNCLNEEG